MWGNWNSHALLMGMWNGTLAVETSIEVLNKIRKQNDHEIQKFHFLWVYKNKNWKQDLLEIFSQPGLLLHY